jgi:hypothetical protein
LTPEQLATVRAKVIDADTHTRGMTSGQRAIEKLACPLLSEGRCVAYEARPLACRGANSYDAEACRRGYENPTEDAVIPTYDPAAQTADAVRSGISNGAGQNRLDGTLLELIAALKIALETPNAGKDWSRGKPVFVPAHDLEMQEIIRRAREGLR